MIQGPWSRASSYPSLPCEWRIAFLQRSSLGLGMDLVAGAWKGKGLVRLAADHIIAAILWYIWPMLSRKKKPNKHPKTGSLAPNNPGRVMAWNILCPGCWRPRDVAQAPHWYLLRWSLPGKGRLSPEVISQTLTGSGGGLFLDHLGSFAPTASADDMGQSGAALGWDYSDYSFGETAVAGGGSVMARPCWCWVKIPWIYGLILGREKHEFLGDHLETRTVATLLLDMLGGVAPMLARPTSGFGSE